jgi:hypothetical protein
MMDRTSRVLQAPHELVREVAEAGKLPVVLFTAGGIAKVSRGLGGGERCSPSTSRSSPSITGSPSAAGEAPLREKVILER